MTAPFECRRERLLHALHRAGVNRVNRLALQIFRQLFRLALAAWRKVHVNAPAENPLVPRLDLAVPDEQQPRGWRLAMRLAPGCFFLTRFQFQKLKVASPLIPTFSLAR